MLTKCKSLYQVKLILDCLPEEEYNLIPEETINYIEDNFEYDENIYIDPTIALESQKIDDKTYEFLDKILKDIEKTKKTESKDNIEEYVVKVKEENENFNNKIEIIRLNELIEKMKKENSKIPKAKLLIEEYKQALNQKNEEIKKIKQYNQKLEENIKKIPKILRNIFIRKEDIKLLN